VKYSTSVPMIFFREEVRCSAFSVTSAWSAWIRFFHHPWYFGPGHPVYDEQICRIQRLCTCRKSGGVNSYVHPVSTKDLRFGKRPAAFGIQNGRAVLGDADTLEVTCLLERRTRHERVVSAA